MAKLIRTKNKTVEGGIQPVVQIVIGSSTPKLIGRAQGHTNILNNLLLIRVLVNVILILTVTQVRSVVLVVALTVLITPLELY